MFLQGKSKIVSVCHNLFAFFKSLERMPKSYSLLICVCVIVIQ